MILFGSMYTKYDTGLCFDNDIPQNQDLMFLVLDDFIRLHVYQMRRHWTELDAHPKQGHGLVKVFPNKEEPQNCD